MSETVISVKIRSPLGFLKKTDMNEGLYLTYNTLHKPALLGILGAIAGLGGFYQSYIEDPKQLPEYYQKLNCIGTGIRPVTGGSSAVFKKSYLQYNNSTGFASHEEGGNLIVKEQILINPAYIVYLKLDRSINEQNLAYESLKNNEAVYIPYLGKNEFQIWWDDFREYKFSEFHPVENEQYEIETSFIKQKGVRVDGVKLDDFFSFLKSNPVFNFERLPSGYDEQRMVYAFSDFVLTNVRFDGRYNPGNLYLLEDDEKEIIVQLN
jgi:CRISPR-associated protein Cas5h